MIWNLRREGPIARYLSFIFMEPTTPSNFCLLAWILILSPLIAIAVRFGKLVKSGTNKIDEILEKSRQRQVMELVTLYKSNPREALRDYYEHFSAFRYNIRSSQIIRPKNITVSAFDVLAKEMGISSFIDILVKLDVIKKPYEFGAGGVAEAMGEWKSAVPPENFELREAIYNALPAIGPLGVTTLVLMPFAFIEEAIAIALCATWTLVVLLWLFFRTEMHVLVYNVYKSIKERTCPLIKWQ